jgi:hypothetical protein
MAVTAIHWERVGCCGFWLGALALFGVGSLLGGEVTHVYDDVNHQQQLIEGRTAQERAAKERQRTQQQQQQRLTQDLQKAAQHLREQHQRRIDRLQQQVNRLQDQLLQCRRQAVSDTNGSSWSSMLAEITDDVMSEAPVHSSCSFIEGVDYYGNDMHGWEPPDTKTAAECCALCLLETECVAWGWNHGGVAGLKHKCFLKTKVGSKLTRHNNSDVTSGSRVVWNT